MLAFAADIPSEKRNAILARLEDLQAEHDVRILFAIESGSRAWGFPSPDSDFDVRFVYVHREDWYLSITPGRDVIETPLIDDWDLNGWDLKKAIGLLIKPNPVLLEWLQSPIHYIWNKTACDQMLEFARHWIQPLACVPHYQHLGQKQWAREFGGASQVKLKKYFYVLRAALAIQWVRRHPDTLPPMNFQELLRDSDVHPAALAQIEHLLALKSRSSEIGESDPIPELDQLIAQEFAWASQTEQTYTHDNPQRREAADTLFRTLLRQTWK